MVALHRGRLECAKALLRAGADPNYINGAGDLTLFWAIDGGVECMKLLAECASCAYALVPSPQMAAVSANAKHIAWRDVRLPKPQDIGVLAVSIMGAHIAVSLCMAQLRTTCPRPAGMERTWMSTIRRTGRH